MAAEKDDSERVSSEKEVNRELIPKKEIDVCEFLRKNPQLDGRGVIIAVIDTGVDPAASGLQVTSDGKPKIIDIIDCSGAGDVDTSTVRSAVSGILTGLSGRKLKIPDSFINPSGKYHLGLKDIYDLYPKSLRDRVKVLVAGFAGRRTGLLKYLDQNAFSPFICYNESSSFRAYFTDFLPTQKQKKEKVWDPLHRFACADAERQLAKFVAEGPSNSLSAQEAKWERENFEGQVEALGHLEKKLTDVGPVADCVVFHDGSTWMACIDADCRGRLDQCTVLSNYRDCLQYGRFSDEDMFTYSFNIHENGNVLEIATTSGSHGTHVAAIAAAFDPERPERNGIAPGAQIIAIGVGDSRLDTMETGTALIRGIYRAVELGAHVINYSYGEASHWPPSSGRILSVLQECVYKHGIMFVSCAGNNGPCLSTLGSPGGSTSPCFAVGAYLSPDMMSTLYSVRNNLDPDAGLLFPWSSRGPNMDGDLGIAVAAPGAAITAVPNWTLRGSQLMNGTSMASPTVCGAVACMISGLKANELVYSPLSIARSLINTAKKSDMDDFFSSGHGLAQVDAAYQYCVRHNAMLEHNVRFEVQIENKHRGVYLRDLHQQQRPRELLVSVEPMFNPDTANDDKVGFSKNVILQCDVRWVEHPPSLEIMNQSRQFTIKINPSSLKASGVYYTEIQAFELNREFLGPLFRIPVTLIVPEIVEDHHRYTLKFEDKTMENCRCYRHFIHVPEGAEWAHLKFQSLDAEKYSRFVFHALQCLPDVSIRQTESYKVVTLTENGDTEFGFAVVGGRTLEVCITKWWSSIGDVKASYSIQFHGLTPSLRRVVLHNSDNIQRVDVRSSLLNEELQPLVSLKTLNQPVRPSEAVLRALGPRDLFTEGKQSFELVLTYNFSIAKTCDVNPLIPSTSAYLYEQEYENQLWMIFSSSKQLLFSGEAYPHRYVKKLEKGDYTLLLQFRHCDKERLECLKELSVIIQQKLPSPINLDCYGNYAAAIWPSGGKKFGSVTAPPGSTTPVYIVGLSPDDKNLKGLSPGAYFSGAMSLAKDEHGKKASQFPVEYMIADVAVTTSGSSGGGASGNAKKASSTVSQKAGSSSGSAKAAAKSAEDLADAIRDLKISWLGKLPLDSQRELFAELSKAHPDHLPLFVAQLKALTEKGLKTDLRSEILATVKKILSLIDRDELLKFFGSKSECLESSVKSEMERKRSNVIDALIARASVAADRLLAANADDCPPYVLENLCFKLQSAASPRPVAVPPPAEAAEDDGAWGLSDAPPEAAAAKKEDGGAANDDQNNNSDANNVAAGFALVPDEEDRNEEDAAPMPKLKEVDEMYLDALRWCDANDSRVVLLSVKIAILHGHFGRALRFLQKALEEKPFNKDYDTLCLQICEKLGWIHAVDNYKMLILVKYPPLNKYRLF